METKKETEIGLLKRNDTDVTVALYKTGWYFKSNPFKK